MTPILYFLLALLAIPYMTWTSRMCGGGKPELPFGLDQWLHALPYLLLLWPVAGPWAILAYLGAFIGKRTGHGGFMDLGHSTKARKPEKLEFLIARLFGKIDEEAYDALGLMVTGAAITLAPALICVLAGHPGVGLVLLMSGVLKASAYAIGWAMAWPEPETLKPTEIGELLTGFSCGAGVFIAALYL